MNNTTQYGNDLSGQETRQGPWAVIVVSWLTDLIRLVPQPKACCLEDGFVRKSFTQHTGIREIFPTASWLLCKPCPSQLTVCKVPSTVYLDIKG